MEFGSSNFLGRLFGQSSHPCLEASSSASAAVDGNNDNNSNIRGVAVQCVRKPLRNLQKVHPSHSPHRSWCLWFCLHTVIPLQHLVNFGLNLADAFAKKLGYALKLKSGLVKLQEENLSSMNTDPWYSAYHYSHSPLVERLAAIDEPDKKTD